MDTDRRALLALGVFGTGSRLGERIERLLERGREFSAPVSKARVWGSAALFAGFMIAASLTPRAIGFAQEIAMFEAATVKPSPPDHIGAQIFSPGP